MTDQRVTDQRVTDEAVVPAPALAVVPSDAPRREAGTRTRSGNAMGRTRAALLQATADCVERYGIRKTTMVDVAARSGVAKATLYNHFRTKDDVLIALVETTVSDLVATAVATASAKGLTAALVESARALETSGPLRTAATKEPALLAPLLVPGPARGWEALRTGLAGVLSAGHVPSGAGEVEVVLRWLTSQVLWPLGLEQAAARADVLVRGLSGTPVSDTAVAAPALVTTPDPVDRVGLGWPA